MNQTDRSRKVSKNLLHAKPKVPAQLPFVVTNALFSLAILGAMSSGQCSSDVIKRQEVDTPPQMEPYTQSVRESVVIIDVSIFP